ncbi:hypothetical protein [Burkholderia sp. BCC1047]|nr:hypothetical protein [Burkholderia sp. BCC1047]
MAGATCTYPQVNAELKKLWLKAETLKQQGCAAVVVAGVDVV